MSRSDKAKIGNYRKLLGNKLELLHSITTRQPVEDARATIFHKTISTIIRNDWQKEEELRINLEILFDYFPDKEGKRLINKGDYLRSAPTIEAAKILIEFDANIHQAKPHATDNKEVCKFLDKCRSFLNEVPVIFFKNKEYNSNSKKIGALNKLLHGEENPYFNLPFLLNSPIYSNGNSLMDTLVLSNADADLIGNLVALGGKINPDKLNTKVNKLEPTPSPKNPTNSVEINKTSVSCVIL